MPRPTRGEGQNAQNKPATTEELVRPGEASEDSDETQAIRRAPSETTEVTTTGRVTGLRASRPRRNYTWLNPTKPPATRAQEPAEERGAHEGGARPAPDPLAHLPPGERPGIVRVREVRRDYEYHYEYIYEEVLPAQAPAAVPQLPPAAATASVPPMLAPAPEVRQAEAPVAARPVAVEPRVNVAAAPAFDVAPAFAVAPAAAPAYASASAPAEVLLRPSLASRAGPMALVAMGVVIAGVATAVYLSTRGVASHAASVAAKPAPAAVETPTAAPPPPPAPAAAPAVTSSVASAAVPEGVASAASSASSASAGATKPKGHNAKKPATATPH